MSAPKLTKVGRELRDDAKQHFLLGVKAERLIGRRQWALLRSYGRLMSGPYSGRYFNALPLRTQHDMLRRLVAGDALPVHLMHRHQSGNYESSSLLFAEGKLWMRFADRKELA